MIKLPNSIKMVITDFDGIVTDNCVYIDSQGNMSRKLNFKDIMAFSLLRKSGFKIGIISGESNSAIDILKKKFDIEEVHQGIRNKLDVLKSILEKHSLDEQEYIYIGDDVNDYESLCYAKYPITVPTAVSKVLAVPNIQITISNPGDGAFREIVDVLINNE